jgi:hypothetical protein
MTQSRALAVARWKQDPRPLPISIRPVTGELVISYLRRIAAANHTDLFIVLNSIGTLRPHPHHQAIGSNTHDLAVNTAALIRLAVFTGITPAALRAATRPQIITTDGPEPSSTWISLDPHQLAHPCWRCTAGRSNQTSALIALAEQQAPLCLTHERALARPGSPTQTPPLNLFPDILAAARRHRALRRTRRATFPRAFRIAAQLIRTWRPFGEQRRRAPEQITLRWQARAERLQRPDTDDLVRYPEVIALTQLFLTLAWRSESGHPIEPIVRAPVQFLADAAEHLQHPAPRELLQPGHPLHRWARTPQRPGYWWDEYGTEPDRTAYFALRSAKTYHDLHH